MFLVLPRYLRDLLPPRSVSNDLLRLVPLSRWFTCVLLFVSYLPCRARSILSCHSSTLDVSTYPSRASPSTPSSVFSVGPVRCMEFQRVGIFVSVPLSSFMYLVTLCRGMISLESVICSLFIYTTSIYPFFL